MPDWLFKLVSEKKIDFEDQRESSLSYFAVLFPKKKKKIVQCYKKLSNVCDEEATVLSELFC